jgi:hypothetical protein
MSLNFRSAEKITKRKKPLGILVAIGVLAGAVALGSTLAASINLNSGGPVEFGQGVAQTTACDSQIIITPLSSFVNGSPGEFRFTGINLSGVDGTDQANSSEGCAGKSFTFKSYDQNGTRLSATYSISVASNGDFSSSDGSTSGTNEGDEQSSVMFTFGTASLAASDIYRITIESSTDLVSGDTGSSHIFVTSDVNSGTIMRANLDGSSLNEEFISNESTGTIGGITGVGSYIYWATSQHIYRSSSTSGAASVIVNISSGNLTGIAADSNYLYWANAGTKSIGRSELNGSNVNESFIENAGATTNDLYGIYVTNSKIYWVNYESDKINVADLDGSNVNNNFISTAGGGPCSVVAAGGYLYWTNWNTNSIGRANLDGTSVDNSFLANASVSYPYYIATDGSQIYWTNFGSSNVTTANLDGSNVHYLFSVTTPIALWILPDLN